MATSGEASGAGASGSGAGGESLIGKRMRVDNKLSYSNFTTALEQGRIFDEDQPRWPEKGEHFTEGRLGEIPIFPGQVKAGLRLPLAPPLCEMCRFYGIAPTQLAPNAIRVWATFFIHCRLKQREYSLRVFRNFYRLTRNLKGEVPEAYFEARANCKIIGDHGKTGSDWRYSWFFLTVVRSTSGRPWKWATEIPPDVPVTLTSEEMDLATDIVADAVECSGNLLSSRRIITEDNLLASGLDVGRVGVLTLVCSHLTLSFCIVGKIESLQFLLNRGKQAKTNIPPEAMKGSAKKTSEKKEKKKRSRSSSRHSTPKEAKKPEGEEEQVEAGTSPLRDDPPPQQETNTEGRTSPPHKRARQTEEGEGASGSKDILVEDLISSSSASEGSPLKRKTKKVVPGPSGTKARRRYPLMPVSHWGVFTDSSVKEKGVSSKLARFINLPKDRQEVTETSISDYRDSILRQSVKV